MKKGKLKNLYDYSRVSYFSMLDEKFVPLTKVIKGEVKKLSEKNFILIEQNLSNILEDSEEIIESFLKQIDRLKLIGVNNETYDDIIVLSRFEPEEIIFLDIETCGLSATPLFLIGLLFLKDKDFIFHQLFARDYTEEKDVISHLYNFIKKYKLLITFNGKSFDYPYIIERGIANGIDFDYKIEHIDLLHLSRRRWRRYLPDCKLQTLEKFVCRRFRSGDIPGREIPQAYQNFVRTGNARDIANILHHNLLDLLTMVEILINILNQIY
mgnify:CR=1 FL=1